MVPCYSSHRMLSTVEGQLPTYPIIAPPPDYLLPALAKDVPAALGSPAPSPSPSLLSILTTSHCHCLVLPASPRQEPSPWRAIVGPPAPFLPLRFPGSSDGTDSTCKAGDPGLISGSGKSPREGNGNPLRYYCLKNPTDRGTWEATIHRATKT